MKKFWILAMVLAIIIGCSKESTSPTEPEQANFVYPIEIGNTWEYQVRLYNINLRGDSLHLVSKDTLITSVKIEITKTVEMPDASIAYEFCEHIISPDGDTTKVNLYYRNESNGLYLVGYQQAGFFLPRPMVSNPAFRFGRISALPGLAPDSLIVPEYSFQTLQYPLVVGSRWAYFRTPEMPYNTDKLVWDSGQQETAAGKFDCFEIEELIDIDNDTSLDYEYEFYDYVSASGLVKRIIYISGLQLKAGSSIDPLNPPIAIYDQVMIFELQNFELK